MVQSVRLTEAELEAYLARRSRGNLKSGAAPPSERSGRRQSNLELRFAQQIWDSGLADGLQREWFFIKDRDFQFDFAYPKLKVAVEVQGMAHRIKGKFQRDIEKRALAQLAGWRVLEVDGASIRSGKAIGWLKELLWQMTVPTL